MNDPLTERTGQGARNMAASLLRYANRQKVAQALTAQGYSVTRMTVNRWARGSEMPEIAARMIGELFGHEGKPAGVPPDVAERLLAGVLALEAKLGISDAELEAARLQAAADAAVADALGSPQPEADGVAGAGST